MIVISYLSVFLLLAKYCTKHFTRVLAFNPVLIDHYVYLKSPQTEDMGKFCLLSV